MVESLPQPQLLSKVMTIEEKVGTLSRSLASLTPSTLTHAEAVSRASGCWVARGHHLAGTLRGLRPMEAAVLGLVS